MDATEPKLIPSVKVTRKELKVTEGAGSTKTTRFEPSWEYELFYPLDGEEDIPKAVAWINDVIVGARKDAEQKEASK